MSTKREPLLKGDIIPIALRAPEEINAMHEAARAKDAELIQRLVDALHIATRYNHYKTFPEEWHNSINIWNRAMEDADAAGFKPSEQ